jgi:hypothetical protein
VLVLDMIVILSPLGKYKYYTWRILPVECYIDNSVCSRSYIRNINREVFCRTRVTDSSPLIPKVYVEIYVDRTSGISHPTSQQEE